LKGEDFKRYAKKKKFKMTNEVEVLKGFLKNNSNFFSFSWKFLGERIVVARLERGGYYLMA
jgi:hypothetical protein